MASSNVPSIEPDGGRPFRLAIVAPLPVQYNVPFFRALAQVRSVESEVLYGSLAHVTETFDPDFGISYAWDVPMLEGYRYRHVKTIRPNDVGSGFTLASPALFRELTPEKFDAALIYGWGDWYSRSALLSCAIRKLPYILTGDATPLYTDTPIKGALKHYLVSTVVRRASACLYVGSLQRVYFERLGVPSDRLFFHPWTIDNELFSKYASFDSERKNKLRADFGLPLDIPLVCFSGKLIRRKRPADLLRAVAELNARGIECGVVYIGEGELKPLLAAISLREELKHVYFLGFVNQSTLPKVLSACDVFCLPSEKDPRATVVAEAMAAGLPVVISHKVGLWGFGDLVMEGKTGFVYTAGQIDELTAKLRKLLEEDRLRQKMAKAAFARMFTWTVDKRVEGLLQAVERIRQDRQNALARSPS